VDDQDIDRWLVGPIPVKRRGRRRARFILDRGRGLCEYCGPRTRKRAIFYDRKTNRALCAACAVERYQAASWGARRRKR
jgi:hypothetical protein